MSRADVAAGRAYVSLYVRQDALTRGLTQAKANLTKFGSDMISLGSRIVAVTGVMATPVAFATSKFAEFDDAMRAVGAVTRATADELTSMTSVAKRLGETTSFTAVQVAQLMTELGRAGFSPEQVNEMTGAVMNLARATGTDAALSAGIMSAAIRQFGLEATDAARVADVLTLAANATFNTVEGLGESLTYAGPVAKELGLSLEDTVAILGSLGNVGIQGSAAGTALRRIGVISAATGDQLRDTFGISNIDAAGNLKPLVQIMNEIGGAVENIPVDQKMEKLNSAFGLLGITSAAVMSRAAVDTDELAEKLRAAAGTAEAAAKSMDAGLGGAFRIIMSAAEGLQLAIGKALEGKLKLIVEAMTRMIGVATEWVSKNEEMVVMLSAIIAGALAAGVAIIGIGVAAKLAAVGIGVAVSAIGVMKLAYAAAVATMAVLGEASVVLGSLISAAWWAMSIASTTSSGIASIAMALFSSAGGAMASAWTAVSSVIAAGWAVILAPVTPFVIAAAAIMAVVAAMAAAIGAIAAAAAWATAKGMDFSAAWSLVKTTLKDLFDTIKRVGGIIMEALSGGDFDIAFAAAIQGIKLVLATAIDSMKKGWDLFWSGALETAKKFFIHFMRISIKAFAAVNQSIANPVGAAQTLNSAIRAVTDGKFDITFGVDTTAMRTEANAELQRLEAELKSRQEARSKTDPNGGPADGATGDGLSSLSAATSPAAENADAARDAFDRETEAIERQIVMLKNGEAAAERARLAKEGLTRAEINHVMALKREEEQLRRQQEEAQTTIEHIQDYADADYEKNKANAGASEEVARKEKDAIRRNLQLGKIDRDTAKAAMRQAEVRQAERDHQARLAAFRGDGVVNGQTIGLKAGGASSATFSAQSLLSMGSGAGQGPQLRALLDAKRAILDQTQRQQQQSDAQIAAIRQTRLRHA